MSAIARRIFVIAFAVASLVAAAPAVAKPTRSTPSPGGAQEDHGKPLFDIREHQRIPAPVPQDRASAKGRDRLSNSLGAQGVLDFEATTNTPRVVEKLDGFLTGPSDDDPV